MFVVCRNSVNQQHFKQNFQGQIYFSVQSLLSRNYDKRKVKQKVVMCLTKRSVIKAYGEREWLGSHADGFPIGERTGGAVEQELLGAKKSVLDTVRSEKNICPVGNSTPNSWSSFKGYRFLSLSIILYLISQHSYVCFNQAAVSQG
jgi:hypothetical protein